MRDAADSTVIFRTNIKQRKAEKEPHILKVNVQIKTRGIALKELNLHEHHKLSVITGH